MEPLLILVVLPIAIGIVAELALRDARNASLAAALLTLLAVCGGAQVLASNSGWTWFAALLVAPLPIALAVGTVLLIYGHSQPRRWQGRSGA
jgi:hypothetical protein